MVHLQSENQTKVANPNHPKKGSTIKVEPIRSSKDLSAIRRIISPVYESKTFDTSRDLWTRDNIKILIALRNTALFNMGVNSAMRAVDLTKLSVGDVWSLPAGGDFEIKEQKTRKHRIITLNRLVHKGIEDYLSFRYQFDKVNKDAPLFQSFYRWKPYGLLKSNTVTEMVKSWCSAINLKGNYGSHTMRKTFGYHQHKFHGRSTADLIVIFNHRSERETLEYLCIQAEDIKKIYETVI